MSSAIRRQKVTTLSSRLPQATKRYQTYLPLMPLALEQLDLREYDLITSSESGPAKGVLTLPMLSCLLLSHTYEVCVGHLLKGLSTLICFNGDSI